MLSGIKAVPEEFQDWFKAIFNMKRVETFIDDLLVRGKSMRKEHDER